jgi:4-hydroxy-3-polyprenylbenzoate decarboxylase
MAISALEKRDRALSSMSTKRRIIIGISGASGAIYGVRLLQRLKPTEVETHLVLTKAAELTINHEIDLSVAEVKALADEVHSVKNVAASISSGSFKTDGMIIAPCSIRSLSEIVTGVTSNLLTRAADVVLKERRRLVLVVRETPLHLGHLRSMTAAAEMGAFVVPPVPAFYAKPKSVDDVINHTVGRVLDLMQIDSEVVRWGEDVGIGSGPHDED